MHWYKKYGDIVQGRLVRSRSPVNQETCHNNTGRDYETVPGTGRYCNFRISLNNTTTERLIRFRVVAAYHR